MSNLLLFLGASLALANLPSSSLDCDNQDWISFKQEHGKTYENEKIESLRLAIFANNKQQVEQFNDKLSDEAGFEVGLNHLADRSNLEVQSLNKYRTAGAWKNSAEADKFLDDILNDNSIEVPDELDWRQVEGRVTHVKDQGDCGSCWAFASTGALEGQERRLLRATTSNQTVELSEQNLVDCDDSNFGCDGGVMAKAFTFIQKQGGLDDEQYYPYEAKSNKCRFNKSKVAFQDKGAAVLPVGDEQTLKEVVAKFGPVAVAIDAGSIWFQFYKKGVYINKSCFNDLTELTHGVLVVGYGTDKKLGDYWIVKNSWGPKWGDDGYILMARNKNNMCGIATEATIPTF